VVVSLVYTQSLSFKVNINMLTISLIMIHNLHDTWFKNIASDKF